MKVKRFPLYARVLCWFFGIIALLGGALVWALRSGAAGDWLIMQQAEPRVQSVARLLLQELQPLPPREWQGVLEKFTSAHGMEFGLFSGPRQISGAPMTPPREVLERLPERPPPDRPPLGQPGPGGPGRAERSGFNNPERPGATPLPGGPQFPDNREPFSENVPFQPLPGPGGNPAFPGDRTGAGRPGPQPPQFERAFPKFLHRTPEAHWITVLIPLRQREGAGNVALLLRITDLAGSGLALDFKPWLWGGAGLLLAASLLWLIPVRGITRAVGQMQRATSDIAAGNFAVQVPAQRSDELGALAAEINRLGARLSGFVTGQKRFLGDTAHELCAPLARMQMAGAALEQRAPEELRPRIADLNSDVENMSALVSELLDFTRAGLVPQKVVTAPALLRDLSAAVLERESAAERAVLNIPPALTAEVNAGLLTRALSNVVRNALRYAGPQASMEIDAEPMGGKVRLRVMDDGPGVPAEALPRLFDPFFRLEESRDRESGGTGLGLAIVKSCVESFGGSVRAANRTGGGLVVEFVLPASGSPER